jgi:hypothetical protein
VTAPNLIPVAEDQLEPPAANTRILVGGLVLLVEDGVAKDSNEVLPVEVRRSVDIVLP